MFRLMKRKMMLVDCDQYMAINPGAASPPKSITYDDNRGVITGIVIIKRFSFLTFANSSKMSL
jgi:hypothetical protein